MFIMQIVCAIEPNEKMYVPDSILKSKATDHPEAK